MAMPNEILQIAFTLGNVEFDHRIESWRNRWVASQQMNNIEHCNLLRSLEMLCNGLPLKTPHHLENRYGYA
jgi:hypothetical protein